MSPTLGESYYTDHSQAAVAVLAICGPYRTGKSYILSRMIGEPKAFELGSTVDACTYGIWVGTTVLECDDFAIVLLDTEGICNVKANATNDAKILVLTVLLSSLFIYNSMKVAQSTDLETKSIVFFLPLAVRCIIGHIYLWLHGIVSN